jgi:hypothetical protein
MDFGAFIVSMSCFFCAGFFTAKVIEEIKKKKQEKE